MIKVTAVGIFWLAILVVISSSQNCSHGDVRLRGGTKFAGRVEVCANGTWGTICDRGWDHNDARVICNQLNLTISDNFMLSGGAACGSACFGEGTDRVFYKDVECTEKPEVFSNCSFSTVGSGGCSNHSNDAGVICALNSCNESTTSETPTISTNELCSHTTVLDDATTMTTSLQHGCAAVGGALGALSGVLAVALGAVLIGWLVWCHRTKHRKCGSLTSAAADIKEKMVSTNGTHYINQAFTESSEHSKEGAKNTEYRSLQHRLSSTVTGGKKTVSPLTNNYPTLTSSKTTTSEKVHKGTKYDSVQHKQKSTAILGKARAIHTKSNEAAASMGGPEYAMLEQSKVRRSAAVQGGAEYAVLEQCEMEKGAEGAKYAVLEQSEMEKAKGAEYAVVEQSEMEKCAEGAEYAVLEGRGPPIQREPEVGGRSAVVGGNQYAEQEENKVATGSSSVENRAQIEPEQSEVERSAANRVGGDDAGYDVVGVEVHPQSSITDEYSQLKWD